MNFTHHATVELWDTQSAPSTYWRIQCNGSQSGNCNTTWDNVKDSGSPGLLATALGYASASDEINVSINVTVPNNEGEGAKNGQITFTCTEA